MDGITPELCDALSALTHDEWNRVRSAMDGRFKARADALFNDAYAQMLDELGPTTCGVTGHELYALATSAT